MSIIRQAASYDTRELEELFLIVRQATFITRPPEEFKLDDYTKSIEGEEVWVIEHNHILIGFISFWRPTKFIHNLFVLPSWQNKGFGSTLLKAAEECLGLPLSLKVEMDNLGVSHFYQKHGFEYISTHPEPEDRYVLYRKYA